MGAAGARASGWNGTAGRPDGGGRRIHRYGYRGCGGLFPEMQSVSRSGRGSGNDWGSGTETGLEGSRK